MLPGVYLPPEGLDLLKNARMAVVLSDTNLPVAVGMVPVTTVISKRSEMVGKGLVISHLFGDQLWKSGSKVMIDAEKLSQFSAPEGNVEEEDIATLEAAQAIESAKIEGKEGEEAQQTSSSAPGAESSPSEVEGAEVGEQEPVVDEETGTESEATEGGSVEEMEELIQNAFMQALKRRVRDKDLPMLASKFWAEYCIPCRIKGSVLNLKKTSWKKLITFLETHVRDGLICINTTDQGVTSIVAVIRDHPKLEGFRTLAVSETAESELEEASASSVDDTKPVVQEFWTLHKKLEFLLVTLENREDGGDEEEEEETESIQTLKAHLSGKSNRTKYFSKPQINTLLRDYVQLRELAHPTDSKLIVLDLNLCNAFFPGGKMQAGQTITKKDLNEAFNAKIIPIKMVTVNGEVMVESGANVGSINIIIEARGGNKIVTRIQGLHHFGLDPKEVGKKASKKFASSPGTGNPDAKGREELLLQGNLEKQGPLFLNQEYNIPLKHIKVEVKGNVKKKGR